MIEDDSLVLDASNYLISTDKEILRFENQINGIREEDDKNIGRDSLLNLER